MIKINKKFIGQLLIVLVWFVFITPQDALAATSPTLAGSSSYSVIGGAEVTNTGSTTTTGAVGVSPGTSISGFPPGVAGGGGHIPMMRVL